LAIKGGRKKKGGGGERRRCHDDLIGRGGEERVDDDVRGGRPEGGGDTDKHRWENDWEKEEKLSVLIFARGGKRNRSVARTGGGNF